MRKKTAVLFLLCILLCTVLGGQAENSPQAVISGYGNGSAFQDTHEDITRDLILMLEHNPTVKALLEKSIRLAKEMNPDPEMNPVSDLESYYDFVDFCYRCMPWEICPGSEHFSLYDRIDQGMGCLYFVINQPLDELAELGYYHNSLMYHEPFRSWLVRFLYSSGQFLTTEASWCEAYYRNAYENPDFHLQDDTYESPENWKSFNDFFARRLKDPEKRPITARDDESIVISPADSTPQGLWAIGTDNRIVTEDTQEPTAVDIKTGNLTDVSVLLEGSAYANAFGGGQLTHTFLDINDYHRYHIPVSGTIREVMLLCQDDAPGGVITWDAEKGRYVQYYSASFGWQSIETRGVVIIETDAGGYVAIIPVGMCQVSSVNFEKSIVPGARVEKGDPLGYFLFGGSDIVMLFSKELSFEMTAEQSVHLQMGQAYGKIRP
ncbi:MAG: phosphatidylserine decarboxylase [Clostridia bacterium]|nr:phosphatidylserine decarboxylase [Clostridia bacterium]